MFCISLEGQIKEVIHKAFWDSLAESLQEDPPDYTHALVLLKEVKEVIKYNCSAIRTTATTDTHTRLTALSPGLPR